MAYALTRKDITTITDPETAFGTTRLLPALEDIPVEFTRSSNLYTRLASALMFNHPMPDCHIVFLGDFKDEQAGPDINRCVRAHLTSCSPDHDHKIAGVAFMISKVMRLVPPAEPEAPIEASIPNCSTHTPGDSRTPKGSL